MGNRVYKIYNNAHFQRSLHKVSRDSENKSADIKVLWYSVSRKYVNAHSGASFKDRKSRFVVTSRFEVQSLKKKRKLPDLESTIEILSLNKALAEMTRTRLVVVIDLG